MFALLRETYRLLRKHVSTYFVIFVLETLFLFILLSVSALSVKFPEIRETLENRFTAKVFIKDNVKNSAVEELLKEIRKNGNITVFVITSEKAAEIFARKMNMKSTYLLREIHFPLSLSLKFGKGYSYSKIKMLLNSLAKQKIVESVKFPKRIAYEVSKHIFLVAIAFLAGIIILLWGLYSVVRQFSAKIIEMTKRENEIKKLIGVKPMLIKYPYVLAASISVFVAILVVLGVYFSVMYITKTNILLEKRLYLPIIITLIFAIILTYKQNVNSA